MKSPLRPTRRAAAVVARTVVLATVVAGTSAFTALHKDVMIEVDGQVRSVSAFGRTVEDVLDGHGVRVGAQDEVFPTPGERVADGDVIVVRTAKDVSVEIDGRTQTFASTALTVGEVLDELGPRVEGASVSASRSDSAGREPLKISTLKRVLVAVDGAEIPVTTRAETVRDVLVELGVVLEPGDVVSASLDSLPVDGQTLTIGRAASSSTAVTEVIPFAVEEVADPAALEGTRKVTRPGRVGNAVTTYDITVVDGVETDRTVVAQSVTRPPVSELVAVGTLVLPDPSTVVVDPGSARALGKVMAAEKGWDDAQFQCLDSLWTKESNWSVTADNPSSSAYGIPQSLPGSKMASAGADWETNAATQITWGMGYIESRYGTPCSAWAHSKAKNWY